MIGQERILTVTQPKVGSWAVAPETFLYHALLFFVILLSFLLRKNIQQCIIMK